MFTFVRNLAGFPANPSIYPLTADVAFAKGNLVKASSAKITNAAHTDTEVIGVMAEKLAANEKAQGAVYDNPFNVYRAPYEGTEPPALFSTKSTVANKPGVVNAVATGGPLTVIAVDTVNKTVDVIITGHTLTVQEIPAT